VRQQRKRFYAFSADATFHTAWVNRVVVGSCRSVHTSAIPESGHELRGSAAVAKGPKQARVSTEEHRAK
jgi:hypothetical protein